MSDSDPVLSPRLHDVLGLTAPIIQSGMGGVAGPDLAAAVSNAGGLGVLAALRLAPDQVRAGIARMRELTDRPFGVNIWLHRDVRHTPEPESVPDDVVRGVQSTFNELRPRFDLEPTLELPDPGPDLVDDALEVMIEERIPVFCAAVGVPEAELVGRFHQAGSLVVAMVGSVDDARTAVANGVDVLVAQGSEAGGHRSFGTKLSEPEVSGQSTFVLVADTLDAVGQSVPVLGAGGIVDGRGLAAMLALGADGVLLGTRFVATVESMASDIWKQRLTSGNRETTLTDGFTGQWARVLRSEFTDHWDDADQEALPGLLQAIAGSDIYAAAQEHDDDQMQPLYAGAAAARLSDLPSAADVVHQLVDDARASLARFT